MRQCKANVFCMMSAQVRKQVLSFQFPDFTEILKLVAVVADLCGFTTVAGQQFQFERLVYFVANRVDHITSSRTVFNLEVRLKDSWGSNG
jgi:hypothetical protein